MRYCAWAWECSYCGVHVCTAATEDLKASIRDRCIAFPPESPSAFLKPSEKRVRHLDLSVLITSGENFKAIL